MSDSVTNPWDSWAAYTEWTRTKRRKGTRQECLINAALGLAGEVGEFQKVYFEPGNTFAEQIDEAGDILFYTAWVLDAAQEPVHRVTCELMDSVHPNHETPWHNDLAHLLSVAEGVKKHLFHGKELPSFALAAYHGVGGLLGMFDCDVKLIDILKHNVEKLESRYPQGFVEGGGNRVA